MEQILTKLLVADNKVIQQGTKELKEAFKNPEAIPALCDVIVTSTNPQVRQSAAVLLRRKLGKKRLWSKLNPLTKISIKEGMLRALVNEREKLVKNSIAQFIGILGKHEFPDDTWPEVLQFVHTLCSSDNVFDKELGMYTLSIMTEISQSSYIVHAESFAILFDKILTNLTELNSNLAYYTVITMNNLVSVIGGMQHMINVYHGLLPRVLEIINSFAQDDEKKACELFEILEELIEYAVAVVVPHIRTIVEMCLRIGSDSAMPTMVQIKAISVVGWLIRSKGKAIQKNNLVEPIIDVLIRLMAQQPDDDVNEEYFLGDPDQYTSITIATQTLDLIALHIPSEKVVPYLMMRIEPALQGDIYAQKAAYLSLAVLAEGCAERIRSKYLKPFLKCVCNAIHNPNVVVRNAALFALGQFSEHLQPEISQYAGDVLPVLFEYLNQIYAQMESERTESPTLDKLFYALETFCENLEEGLMPYLPMLMERLFIALDPAGWSMQLKRIALNTLGSAASAVKEGMLPYFPKVIEILNVYINTDPNSEIYDIQSYAIEALAVIAQFIGADNFRPLAHESLHLGMRILEGTDDPDVRKSIYALFAALAIVMKEELSPVLLQIVDPMILSIQSSEGITMTYEEDEKDNLDVYAELSDDDDDGEEDIDGASSSSDDDTVRQYSVENSYNEEKEQACLALRQICMNTGSAFLPYIVKSFEEIFKLINYPQYDIRKVSVEALLQFCIALYKINTNETKKELYKYLQMFIPKCAELIRTDEERDVVIICLEAYASLLDEIKGDVLVGEGHREAIMNCVIDVLTHKTMCQDTDSVTNPENNDEDTEAEQDELLLEAAGDVIPKFASAIKPDDFVLYFPNVLELLTQRTKKQNSLGQRSFAFGTLAECMRSLAGFVGPFKEHLLHLWLTGAKDSAGEVRNNAIFGLGEMILHGKEHIFPYYQELLQALSSFALKEAHAGSLDNICGALAKMIITNSSGVPLDQVFPAFLQQLPLRDDYQENEAVINCFVILYQQGHEVVRQNMVDVIKIAVQVYCKKQYPNDETKAVLIEFIKTVNRDFSQEFVNTVTSLGPEVTQSLQELFANV